MRRKFVSPKRFEDVTSIDSLREALFFRRRYYTSGDNTYSDYCAACDMHESEHAGDRCLLRLSRFTAYIPGWSGITT